MVWACQTLCLNSWPGLTCIPCIRPTTTNSSVLFGSFQCQAWESCATHIYTPLHSSGGLSGGDGCVGLGLWFIWLHQFRMRWHSCALSIVYLFRDNVIVILCLGSSFRCGCKFKFDKLKMHLPKLHTYLTHEKNTSQPSTLFTSVLQFLHNRVINTLTTLTALIS